MSPEPGVAADRAPARAQATGEGARRRVGVRVEGTVQGVGFRPYVYRLARELGLGGHVFNDARGVVIEAQGVGAAIEELLRRLPVEAPPLAVIERTEVRERPLEAPAEFAIVASPRGVSPDAPVTPDSTTCPDCLRELFDPADRRFRYPFINCTNCGPRFTIVRGIPYDRPLTTMAGFRMCERCRAEYDDPGDRRFHAQPNACPQCGPVVRLITTEGRLLAAPGQRYAISAAVDALIAGQIVAIKGIGGYHLACRADDEHAVAQLRGHKHREDKPFALMTGDRESADRLVELDAVTAALLSSPERPIVLAPRRPGAPVAAAVAPGAPELGVMLAYSPLHHLLLADAGMPLVMTSGNVSDEPIAFRDEDARARLAPICDLLLTHDRPIQTRTDDSVARVVSAGGSPRPMLLRRSRGYVPHSLALSAAPDGAEVRPLLACGAELKNTLCLARGKRAWVSHHIGDLQNAETLSAFVAGVEHLEALFAVAPETVAHDLHPDYLSTRYALEREGVELVGVQHHHAHLAAVLAEHDEWGPAVGAIFDGTGYGPDGTVWGGEILFGDRARFERVGRLHAVPMPGGERAIRQPWRMACAWLAATENGPPAVPVALEERVAGDRWRRVARLAESGLASPSTTSMGRLFDAVAALCGVRPEINYEGQAAIELEALCDPQERGRYAIALSPADDGLELDPRASVAAVAAEIAAGVSPSVVAARFHNTVAAATAQACLRVASDRGAALVVLGGGVFANRRLLEHTGSLLVGADVRVLVPERLPPGDGGISFGQAAVAAARMGR